MKALHFVFRATAPQRPLITRDHYVLLWNQLCSRLDRCIALVLMPNHGHILAVPEDQPKVQQAIRLSLRAFRREHPSFWDPIPEPTVIPDGKHLNRQIRYVHLNPSRNGLIKDPLCWEFSTHWDFMNYAVSPMSVPAVQYLGMTSKAQFHKYISADPSTNVAGTALPKVVRPHDGFPLVTLDRVAELTRALTRGDSDCLQKRGAARQLFYVLAAAAGYENRTELARYLKIAPQSVLEFLATDRPVPLSVDLARELLCDPRIRPHGL